MMCIAVRNPIRAWLLALGLLAASCEVAAAGLTVERLVAQPSITGTAPSAVSWSADNRHLAFLWNDAGLPGREVWIVNADGTQLRKLTTPATPAQGVREFVWTPDSSAIVFLRGGDLWRTSVTADSDDRLQHLASVGRGDAANLAVSPDGAYASFLEDGDLWLLRLATRELTQATRVGVPSIASVSYGEYNRPDVEIGPYIWGSPTYAWSPDSRTIAVHYVDRRGLRKVPFPYYLGKETEANTVRRNYPGDPNESRTVGFFDVAAGELQLIDLPEPTAIRIADFSWSGDGTLLLDRESDTAVDRWIDIIDPRSGKRREIWHDSRDTRIYNSIGAAWHADGKQIVIRGDLADRYGLYLLRPGSKQPKLLTDERFDVTDGPFVAGRSIYYQSNEPSPHERHVYRVAAGGGKATRITTLSGDNQPFPSPDGTRVAILHSDDVTPADLYLTDARGTSMRRITTSPPAEFAKYTWVPGRYVTFPSRIDKHTLHARILAPADLDPDKTYPVIFGPVYSNTVRNRWVSGLYGTLQQLLVQRGYIVVQVDVRGSTGYGRAFREEFLADFAGRDLDDLHSAVAYLETLPYVDSQRLGIWGSSYGGTLTVYSLLRKPGLFKAGVAAAAAVDPYFFGTDDVAIVRRPDSRPDAFERGAAQYAGNLQDHLLIIHGMQDNVVPFKTTVVLAEELMRQGKDFDFAFAPAAMHRWPNEPHYARYLLGKLVAHFDRHLGAKKGGPQPAARP